MFDGFLQGLSGPSNPSKRAHSETEQSYARSAPGIDARAIEQRLNDSVVAHTTDTIDAKLAAFRQLFKEEALQAVNIQLGVLEKAIKTRDDVITQLQAQVASQDSRLASQDSEIAALKAQQQARPVAAEMQADIADLKVQQEAQQRQANSKYLVVYGVQEQAGDPAPLRTVNNKLTAVGSSVQAASAVRLGKEPTLGKPRPVKIEVVDRQAVFSVARKLRTQYNIRVKPCLTKQQQQTCKKLQPEAKRLFERGYSPFWREDKLLYKDTAGRTVQFVPGAGAGAGDPRRAVPGRGPPRAPAPGRGSRTIPATGANTTPVQGQATPAAATSAAPSSYAAAAATGSGSPATDTNGQQAMEA
jgi:hypothetical protein